MKPIVYSSPFLPAEWIAAHGLQPQRVRPGPPAGAPSAGPPAGMCPYARAFVGEAVSWADAAAIVLTTTCDQMRRASEWIGLRGGPARFLLNVPATWQTPSSARLYLGELRRLGRFLVRVGGSAPPPGRLAEVMEDYDGRRERLRGLMGTLGPRAAAEALARFDLGLEPQAGPLPLAGGPRGAAVALVGGPLMRGDERVFDAIAQAGGRVVLDATESGVRTLPAPFDRRRLREAPLLELVDAYFGAIPDVFRRPDTALMEYLRREAAASGARGLILWRYLWCDLWAASAVRLREQTGLPVLDLDVSGEGDPLQRAAHRIQAFLEVLQ